MFYHRRPMATLSPDVTAAVATLQARWGAAAPRTAGSPITDGALALAPATAPAPATALAPATAPSLVPTPIPTQRPEPTPALTPDDRVIHTGFAALGACGRGRWPLVRSPLRYAQQRSPCLPASPQVHLSTPKRESQRQSRSSSPTEINAAAGRLVQGRFDLACAHAQRGL